MDKYKLNCKINFVSYYVKSVYMHNWWQSSHPPNLHALSIVMYCFFSTAGRLKYTQTHSTKINKFIMEVHDLKRSKITYLS